MCITLPLSGVWQELSACLLLVRNSMVTAKCKMLVSRANTKQRPNLLSAYQFCVTFSVDTTSAYEFGGPCCMQLAYQQNVYCIGVNMIWSRALFTFAASMS